LNGLTRSLLFGNYFYGSCAIALSIEASLQQHFPLNSPAYYLFVFSATVVYYTHAYIAEPKTSDTANLRTNWYSHNHVFVKYSQVLLTLVFFASGFYLLRNNWQHILQLGWEQWAIIGIFPLVAALYYGSVRPDSSSNSLRNRGWLKPFVIGFVWAGAVTTFPVLFSSLENGREYIPGFVGILLFIKNFMYITMLCIMFDIKDYAADHNHHLKTFVVRWGLRRTIFYVLIPLSMVGLGTFILYAVMRDFPVLRILINTIPFILLIIVAYSMHRRKSILYYLAIIDGLMLAKAICGTIGITLIK
jgi:4-hydroxybenzoate polyprenyltransferase